MFGLVMNVNRGIVGLAAIRAGPPSSDASGVSLVAVKVGLDIDGLWCGRLGHHTSNVGMQRGGNKRGGSVIYNPLSANFPELGNLVYKG